MMQNCSEFQADWLKARPAIRLAPGLDLAPLVVKTDAKKQDPTETAMELIADGRHTKAQQVDAPRPLFAHKS